jgi:hypothetical protein
LKLKLESAFGEAEAETELLFKRFNEEEEEIVDDAID